MPPAADTTKSFRQEPALPPVQHCPVQVFRSQRRWLWAISHASHLSNVQEVRRIPFLKKHLGSVFLGDWGDWGNWTACSANCDQGELTGERERERHLLNDPTQSDVQKQPCSIYCPPGILELVAEICPFSFRLYKSQDQSSSSFKGSYLWAWCQLDTPLNWRYIIPCHGESLKHFQRHNGPMLLSPKLDFVTMTCISSNFGHQGAPLYRF